MIDGEGLLRNFGTYHMQFIHSFTESLSHDHVSDELNNQTRNIKRFVSYFTELLCLMARAS